MSVLKEIFAEKRRDLQRLKASRPLSAVEDAAKSAPDPHNFVACIRGARTKPALIAEVKKSSPSAGLLAAEVDPVDLAGVYARNGATAVSVLTEHRYFDGKLDDLYSIRKRWRRLPLLRKDFIFDPYQIYETRAAGADAVLLIAAALGGGQLRELHALAADIGLTALVEVHSLQELEMVLRIHPVLVGINNRNLHDMRVRLEVTERLRPCVPEGIAVVAESGVRGPSDVARMANAGADAVLIGEALVTSAHPAGRLEELMQGRRNP